MAQIDNITDLVYSFATGMNRNSDNKLDKREVRVLVNECVAVIAKKNAYENAKIDGVICVDGQFISTYENIPIEFNKETNEWFSILPTPVVGLPSKSGVQSVSPMGGSCGNFWQVDVNANTMFSALEGFTRKDVTYWRVRGNKILFSKEKGVSEKKVMITLVGLGDADIPTDYAYEIIEMAKKMIMPSIMLPQDKINDGASIQ